MTLTKMRTVVLLALIGSAIASFTITTNMVLGQSEQQVTPGEVTVVDTLEAAETLLDINIHTPSYVPDGFERGKIHLSRFNTTEQEPVILQFWHRSSDRAFFILEESSTLAGFVGESTDATIGTKQVKRSSDPANSIRNFGLDSYFWSQDGKGIVLTFLDSDAIDNDTKGQIANSIAAE